MEFLHLYHLHVCCHVWCKLLTCKHSSRMFDNPENASQPRNLLHLKRALKWNYNSIQYAYSNKFKNFY